MGNRPSPAEYQMMNDLMAFHPAVQLTLTAGGHIGSGGLGWDLAARAEVTVFSPLWLMGQVRGMFHDSRAYLGEVTVGYMYEDEAGTVWVPAGSATYQSERVIDTNYYTGIQTVEVSQNTVSWSAHCVLAREQVGVFGGARVLRYPGDDVEIPGTATALQLGWIRKFKKYKGGSEGNEAAIAVMYAPPGLAGDEGHFGLQGRFGGSLGITYIAIEAGGLFGQFGFLSVDLGLALDL